MLNGNTPSFDLWGVTLVTWGSNMPPLFFQDTTTTVFTLQNSMKLVGGEPPRCCRGVILNNSRKIVKTIVLNSNISSFEALPWLLGDSNVPPPPHFLILAEGRRNLWDDDGVCVCVCVCVCDALACKHDISRSKSSLNFKLGTLVGLGE